MKKIKELSVAQMIVLSYLILICIGAFLLSWPLASQQGHWTAWDDY